MVAVEVEHDPASAAKARQLLAEDLGAHHVTRDCIDDAVLVVSELVGNAVVHTGTDRSPIDIGWSVDDTSVTVWVQDESDGCPQVRCSDSRATSGRGMAIIAAVSAEWGVERVSRGKRVWARIALPA